MMVNFGVGMFRWDPTGTLSLAIQELIQLNFGTLY